MDSSEVQRSDSGQGPTHLNIPKINLDFIDLSYPAKNTLKIKNRKPILQEVSGSFKSGELTAILGSSGAGKSTLLNILTGFLTVDVEGSIRINGHPCQMKMFRKLSNYIMQEDLVQPYLSVEESLNIATNLKLGKEFSEAEKTRVVNNIIETLGLEKHKGTRTEKLSGGQKKRVSIALELVNNPPVIFLDEPTTGLDVVSTTQVIELLQKLARQGRTVVCTIHQPSAFLCKYFDHMYFMTKGICVYQGSYQKLVPFMSYIGWECPKTYNPADYIVEIIQGPDENIISEMMHTVENGKLSIESSQDDDDSDEGNFQKILRQQKVSTSLICLNSDLQFPITFVEQFRILLGRKMKQQFRNLLAVFILLFHHILTGFLLGTTFQGVGDDPGRHFENFKFLISVVVFFMYSNVMGPVLLFPLEVKLLRREYFNRWYSMESYFSALTLATIPFQITFGILFSLISYTISSQPIDLHRILIFILIGILIGAASEGWGLTVGSLFSCRSGSIVGPATIVPLLVVSVYGMGHGKKVEPFMSALMSMSYLRYGVVGLTTTMYGQNRTLPCDYKKYIYCHYKNSSLFLKDLGMEGSSSTNQVIGLICFLLLFRLTAFLGIKYRLSVGLSNKVLNFFAKISSLR